MLKVSEIDVYYGGMQALRNVSIQISSNTPTIVPFKEPKMRGNEFRDRAVGMSFSINGFLKRG